MTKTIQSTCPACAGQGFVKHRHITNKRNRKKCLNCNGKGETPVVVVTNEKPAPFHHRSAVESIRGGTYD
jgi:DnaJ-class molecular chaperone